MVRDEVVKARLSEGEMRAVRKRAKALGLGLSEYLRMVVRKDAGYDPGPTVACPSCRVVLANGDEFREHLREKHGY